MNKKIEDSEFSFRPKARILKTLGEELISSETVALIELVKNAYDADAKNVLIKFSVKGEDEKNSVVVFDDGHGMNMDVIRDSWMIISTSTKKNNHKSNSGKRRVLGEKGIGRFASSRLASELELITRTPDSKEEIYTVFDWSQFDNDELYLDDVVFLTEERQAEEIVSGWELEKIPTKKKSATPSGTILCMNSLKHKWENKDFSNLQRGLSRLISPFNPINDFNIYIQGLDNQGVLKEKIESPDIIKYPHYSINGYVNNDGSYEFSVTVEELGKTQNFEGYYHSKFENGKWSVISTKASPNDMEEEALTQIQCGGFNFELRIWDRDDLGNVVQKLGGGVTNIRKDLDAIAGINIYRDGFRVLPYGEPNNDWLRLDIRRVQKPTRHISNNQITGYISITADGNPKLHDRSNREGLDNNIAYFELEQIMELILLEIENIRYAAKRKKKTTKNDSGEQRGLFDQPDFTAIKESVKKEGTDSKETIALITKVEADWKNQVKDFQDVLSQYHALATLGSIIDKVLHDGRQPLATIQTEAGLGKELAAELHSIDDEKILLQKIDTQHFVDGFKRIIDQATILRDVFRRVEPFGGRKRGRPRKYYIEDIIRDNFAVYRKEISENNIIVDLPNTETLVSIDVTELSEIFTNLITNSIYWLSQVPKNKRFIRVLISRLSDGELEIIFSDTGPGIDTDYKELIFEPYFSRKPGGHGLGLCLVGEIVKDYYGGSVELMDSGKGGGTVFRIVIKKRV